MHNTRLLHILEMTYFVGEWQSFSKTTDYFNFVHPLEHGCPHFCICIVFHWKFVCFCNCLVSVIFQPWLMPICLFCHCSCTLLSCLWHCTPCDRTGLPMSVFLLGGNYKRPLICIVHGSLLICCQQLSLSNLGSPVSALMVILHAAFIVYSRPWQSLNLHFRTMGTAEFSSCNLWAIF